MLKSRSFLIFILVVCFYACRQQGSKPSPVKNINYEKAESFLDRHNDSAYYYFNKVVSTTKDSLQVARAYTNMAVIQYGAGDYFGAQEMLTRSLKLLDERNEKHYRCLSSDYNELGLTYMKLGDYDAALPLYDLAYKYSANEIAKRISLNNKALTFGRKKDYTRALVIYRSILAQPIKSRKEYARTLSNMAITNWRVHPEYNATPLLFQALEIRKKEKDLWGQNASYHHLSDYYMRSHPDSALFFTNALLATAKQIGSPDDRQEALRKLIILNKPYFVAYQQLTDSLQTARNAAKNQFALIRYDAEKNKADNLKLQKDNTENRYKIIKQQFLLGVSLLVLLTGSVLVMIWNRRRKERMEREKLDAVRDSELKTSKKVHDVVANGIYMIITELEHHDDIDKGNLLDQLEQIYEQSRDISYEKEITLVRGFDETISDILTSFGSDSTKVSLVGNDERIWGAVNPGVQYELQKVLQELMVNMKKHSRANVVVIKFEEGQKVIRITYTDDGVGMSAEAVHGNGLKNTVSRIKNINGDISFGTNEGNGLEVKISFPF